MRCALLVLLGGCEAVFPLEEDPSRICGGTTTTALTDLCFDASPDAREIRGTINTGDPAISGDDCEAVDQQGDPNSTEVCIITGAHIEVGNTLVVGSRPLVLVARDDLIVSGTLSAASHLGPGGSGAGANPARCDLDLAGMSTESPDGAPGGAGGSFGTSGGDGGDGSRGNGNGGDLGPDASLDNTPLTFIRGGCPGGNGGTCHGRPAKGGRGGDGGGAVYLIAGGTIRVTGTIDASGSGGQAGESGVPLDLGGGGGGGGGSGGLIGLDAPSIVLEATAILLANGGGGGSGGGNADTNGQDGSNPNAADDYPFIGPGGESPVAGDGGDGSTAENFSGDGASEGMVGGGGGGGGGGTGQLVISGLLDDQSLTSPDPSTD